MPESDYTFKYAVKSLAHHRCELDCEEVKRTAESTDSTNEIKQAH